MLSATSSAAVPYANNCFAELVISLSSNGDLTASLVNCPNTCAPFSALPVNESIATRNWSNSPFTFIISAINCCPHLKEPYATMDDAAYLNLLSRNDSSLSACATLERTLSTVGCNGLPLPVPRPTLEADLFMFCIALS